AGSNRRSRVRATRACDGPGAKYPRYNRLRPMRRWLVPVAVFLAVTLPLISPLLPQFGSAFPHDSGDPALNTWILWWNTQAVPLTRPWWNAPMFYPMAGAMALSEVLIGLLPIAAP